MDAISFILGVHTAHLCGYQLKDLIYAADDLDRDQRGRKAFVRLIYRFTDGSEIQFTGGITSAGGSEYRVEGQVVNWEEYSSKLKSLGPFKARNFLVFQKSIEDKLKKLKQEKESIKEVILRITPELHKLRNVIAERTSKISSLEKRINEIVDQTCKKFSESVGVKNIREYEENQLKAAQEMPEEMLNLRNQQSKLKYQSLPSVV